MELEQVKDKPNATGPNRPERDIPVKPDKNPDPTQPRPGINDPNKIDPTRIEEPEKTDPTRIKLSRTNDRGRKMTKVSGWDEVMERMKDVH